MSEEKQNTPSADTDWKSIHQRIEQAAEKLKQGISVSGEEGKKILQKRARQLAQTKPVEETGECIEVVEFRLADERYAVECNYVREVYPLKTLTPVPGTPDFILGIISLRGEIISVVDLKKFFAMPVKGLTDLTRVIVLRHHDTDMEFGILAEEVPGTISLPVNDIRTPPPTLTGIRGEYLKGVIKDRLIVLDASRILADKKMIVHQEVDI